MMKFIKDRHVHVAVASLEIGSPWTKIDAHGCRLPPAADNLNLKIHLSLKLTSLSFYIIELKGSETLSEGWLVVYEVECLDLLDPGSNS